jgi:hypothetical protein
MNIWYDAGILIDVLLRFALLTQSHKYSGYREIDMRGQFTYTILENVVYSEYKECKAPGNLRHLYKITPVDLPVGELRIAAHGVRCNDADGTNREVSGRGARDRTIYVCGIREFLFVSSVLFGHRWIG